MLVKITKVFPMVSREYRTREGRTEIFYSKPFLFTDGRSSMFAEATMSTAQSLESLNLVEGNVGNLTLVCMAREYTDTKGTLRYSNELTVQSFMPI